MSKIKGKNTLPEKLFWKELSKNGIRFKKNYVGLPGKPDVVINKYKIVVFVDGVFWHGYKWVEKRKRLKSNKEYWIPKIETNIKRDKKNNVLLKRKVGLF